MSLLKLVIWIVVVATASDALPAQQPEPRAEPSPIERAAAARIQPGDRVVVRVWREPELTDTAAVVNERSEIVLPRLGIISVRDHSPVSLRDSLRARYAAFLRSPVVDVSVFRRIVVNGEVEKPGIYYVDVSTTLRDIIAEAGGLREHGDVRKVAIVRGAARLPVADWQRDRSLAADLQSGDQVVVGRRHWLATNALGLMGAMGAVATLIIALR